MSVKRMGPDHAVLLFVVLCRALGLPVRLLSGFSPQTLKPTTQQMEELGLGSVSGGSGSGAGSSGFGSTLQQQLKSSQKNTKLDLASTLAQQLGEAMGIKFSAGAAAKLRATLHSITAPSPQQNSANLSSLATSATRTGLQRLNLAPSVCVCQSQNLLPPYVPPVWSPPPSYYAAAAARARSNGRSGSDSAAAAAAHRGPALPAAAPATTTTTAAQRRSSSTHSAPPPPLRTSSSAATAIDLTGLSAPPALTFVEILTGLGGVWIVQRTTNQR